MADKKSGSGINIWMVLLVLSMVSAIVLTMTTASYARKTSIQEAMRIEEVLGADTLDRINDIADGWYRFTVKKLDTRSAEGSEDVKEFIATHPRVGKWIETRTEAALDLAYWFFRRLALFVIWIPWWLPMLFLSIMHGYWNREIKKTDFGYTSPVKNRMARQTMFVCLMMTMILFVLPISLEPFLFPVLMALATICSGIAIGNIQKRL
jgi:hypothetical protein